MRFAGEEGPARTLTQAPIEADPARRLEQPQIGVAWAWADFPPVDLDRLDPQLALPEYRLCDEALRSAWSEARRDPPLGVPESRLCDKVLCPHPWSEAAVQACERGYGPPAGCSGAAAPAPAAR